MMRWFLLVFFWAPLALAGDVIIVGSGGNQEYSERFDDWGVRLRSALINQLKRDKDQVHLFLEKVGEGSPARTSDLATLQAFFKELAQTHSDKESLNIYLIGHGSFLRGIARLHIPGPDLVAEDFGKMLAAVPAKQVVVINSSSSSAPFINVLSGAERIICSATKSGSEQNATEFMGFFIRCLEEDLADQDYDGRISVWEAARQAASMTEKWYQINGLIATEHAILDDNGDGLGSRLYLDPTKEKPMGQEAEARDGALAQAVFLRDFHFPDTVPQELIDRYLGLVSKAKALKKRKQEMGEKAYWAELEKIMLQAARAHREIRAKSAE